MTIGPDCRRAVVVGAGIGGAGAALLLARAGIEVILIDRVAAPKAVGAGILLAPNGLAVLYGLGLEAELCALAAPVDRGSIHLSDGRPLVTEPLPGVGPDIASALVISRSALFDILLGAVRRQPNIDLRLGVTAVGVLHDGSGVTAREGDATIDLRADLLLGADGVHSTIRDYVDPEARAGPSGYSYVRGLVPGEPPPSVGESWTELGLFGAAPVNADGLPGAVYFFTSILPGPVAAAVEARDLGAFRALWRRALPGSEAILGRLQSFDELLVNDVQRVDCRTFVRGRFALLGDAAHAMAPNLGQGANSALVDGAVLLHALRTESTVADALRTYDARRRPAVRRVQDDADRLARVAQLRGRSIRWLRDLLLPPIAARVDRARAERRVLQEDVSWLRRTASAHIPAPDGEGHPDPSPASPSTQSPFR